MDYKLSWSNAYLRKMGKSEPMIRLTLSVEAKRTKYLIGCHFHVYNISNVILKLKAHQLLRAKENFKQLNSEIIQFF